MSSKVPCYLVGSGMAAQAMVTALAVVTENDPELPLFEVRRLRRGEALPQMTEPSLLLIANPHALHAPLIAEADRKGFTHIVTEKPAAVSVEQVASLRNIKATVAVCHGYRQQWGVQKLRAAVASGELGKIIGVEGRYWQASAAVRQGARSNSWKNDPSISGPHDVYLDLGTHWADLVTFVLGQSAVSVKAHRSFVNAETPHRDTHVHLEMIFPEETRTWASVSKTVHGAGNHLEIVVLGEKATLSWNFERPDELKVARGKESTTFQRSAEEKVASGLPPNHALGWLEGYVSILGTVVREIAGHPAGSHPTLQESLRNLELMLNAERY